MKTPLLQVKDLTLGYQEGRERKVAIENVSFTIHEGEVVGVVGESGCGKTTLGKGLLAFPQPPLCRFHGEILLQGRDLTQFGSDEIRQTVLGKRVAIVPQKAIQALNPSMKIESLAYDLLGHHEPTMERYLVRERFCQLLDEMGVGEEVLQRYPLDLSSGARQRIVIALSALTSPDLLIADEPTSALDVTTQKKVLVMLREMMRKKVLKSLLFITHEIPLLYHIADTIVVMKEGRVVEIGPTEQVLFSPHSPYTKKLMQEVAALDIHQVRARG